MTTSYRILAGTAGMIGSLHAFAKFELRRCKLNHCNAFQAMTSATSSEPHSVKAAVAA